MDIIESSRKAAQPYLSVGYIRVLQGKWVGGAFDRNTPMFRIVSIEKTQESRHVDDLS